MNATASLLADTICRTVELGVTITDAAVADEFTHLFCAPVTLDPVCAECGMAGRMRDHVERRVTDLELRDGRVTGVRCGDERIDAAAVILATGHSARDIYELLARRGVRLEAKPFAMGVRIEHPQALIDSIQYHCERRGE